MDREGTSVCLPEIREAFEPAEKTLKQSQKWGVWVVRGCTPAWGVRGTCPEEHPEVPRHWFGAAQLCSPKLCPCSGDQGGGCSADRARIVPRAPQGLRYIGAEQLKTWAGSEENEVWSLLDGETVSEGKWWRPWSLGSGTCPEDGVLIEAAWPNLKWEVNSWLPLLLPVPAGQGEIPAQGWSLAARALEKLPPSPSEIAFMGWVKLPGSRRRRWKGDSFCVEVAANSSFLCKSWGVKGAKPKWLGLILRLPSCTKTPKTLKGRWRPWFLWVRSGEQWPPHPCSSKLGAVTAPILLIPFGSRDCPILAHSIWEQWLSLPFSPSAAHLSGRAGGSSKHRPSWAECLESRDFDVRRRQPDRNTECGLRMPGELFP